jgi:hypothetical protein
MKNLFIFITILSTLAVSCKYETQYDGPYSDGDSPEILNNIKYEILYVSEGKMYMLDPNLRFQKPIPNVTKTVYSASINYAHDKIAYKTSTGNIIVIDTAGNQIQEIANSSSADIFDWHSNNQTLYYVPYGNWGIRTYGPAISLARTSLSGFLPLGFDNKITGLCIKSDGSMIVSYSYSATFSTVRECKVINANNSIVSTKPIGDIFMDVGWMRMSQNGESVIYGSDGKSGVSSRKGAWKTGFTNFDHNEYNRNAEKGAISPDGTTTIIAADGNEISSSNGKYIRTKGIVAGLDW